ncbi:MAG TPA: P-loop NTPase [Streptosporangiaceae bacterium]|nr:P-loop NTPase [Streptosporangiaceae bacterium]
MPILCDAVAAIDDLAPAIGAPVRGVISLQEAARLLDHDEAETLVVIGPEAPINEVLRFAAGLRLSRPAVGVVLLRHDIDVILLSNALRAGIREVVQAGDQAALSTACARSYEVSRRLIGAVPPPAEKGRTRQGQVVTVFAAKGGCGKTTFAVNLAVALAREPATRVCVVDLDLAFGDVAISVQLDPARTILNALPMAGHIDETGASSLLTRYRPNIDMLLAPVAPGDAEKIPASLTGELLEVLKGIFDYVVIDTPSQLSEHVLTAMDSSAHHVLLTTPDVPALKNLRITLDMLELLAYPAQLRSVVLNRSDSKVGLGSSDVERAARWPIAAHIPSSRDVPVSVNKGTPLVVANPGHPVSRAIENFARQTILTDAGHEQGRRLARAHGRRRKA